MKEQQEQLVLIFYKYRDVCKQAKISASLNFSKANQQNNLM